MYLSFQDLCKVWAVAFRKKWEDHDDNRYRYMYTQACKGWARTFRDRTYPPFNVQITTKPMINNPCKKIYSTSKFPYNSLHLLHT